MECFERLTPVTAFTTGLAFAVTANRPLEDGAFDVRCALPAAVDLERERRVHVSQQGGQAMGDWPCRRRFVA
ncbi:hypothetical protein GCM10009626_28500 [Brachybacterium sacelli]